MPLCCNRSAGLTSDGGPTGNTNVPRQMTCQPGETSISDMALNSTGEIMYSAAGNTVRIWDLRTYALRSATASVLVIRLFHVHYLKLSFPNNSYFHVSFCYQVFNYTILLKYVIQPRCAESVVKSQLLGCEGRASVWFECGWCVFACAVGTSQWVSCRVGTRQQS